MEYRSVIDRNFSTFWNESKLQNVRLRRAKKRLLRAFFSPKAGINVSAHHEFRAVKEISSGVGDGGAAGSAFFMLFIARTSMKIINARIIKLIKMVMKFPYSMVGILAFFKSASAVRLFGFLPSTTKRFE